VVSVSKAIIQQIKEAFILAIESEFGRTKIDLYEGEGFINPRIRLPATSVQRGDRIKADMRDGGAGFYTYNLPFRTKIYTQPVNKKQILPELYLYEEQVEKAIRKAYRLNQLTDYVTNIEYVSSRESTVYDMKSENIFANVVTITFNIIYEVQII